MNREEISTKTNFLTWIAIILASLALVIALFALNQPAGVGPTDIIQDLQTQIRSLQQQAEVSRAQQRLENIGKRLSTGGAEANQQAQQEIAELRNDLRVRFQNAGENAKQSWQQLDNQLEEVERNLRAGGVNILDVIEKAINNLKQDIRYD